MSSDDEITAIIVIGYVNGEAHAMDVLEVECGHLLRSDVAKQARDAIQAGRDAGLHISISSAWRSMEEQQDFYNGWKEGRPGFNPADPPGHSKHQGGVAMDLAFASGAEREEFVAISIAHGFSRPISHEPWHFVIAVISKGVS